jgi:prevent-host-death family protein
VVLDNSRTVRWATRVKLAIILAMETLPLAEIKNRLSEFVERVASQHDRVTITRNGRPAAVLVSPEDLEALEETLSILGDSRALKALQQGLADLDAGRVVSLEQLKANRGLDG